MQYIIDNAQENFAIPDRGIDASTIKHFGIRQMYSEVDQQVEAWYFPVTKKGKTVGFIKYSPNRPKDGGRFTTCGDVTVSCDLLGQSVAPKGRKVFIAEGFFDTLSMWQALNNNKPSGFNGIPAVVSPALGIGDPTKGITNSRQHIATNLDFINEYKDKVVCFDNDLVGDANVGQLGVEDLALLVKEFKNCVLPVNDCNDMMQQEGERELYWALMNAKPFQPEHIIKGGLANDELLEPIKAGVKVQCLPELMKHWRGVRDGELTMLLAPSGVGKSTVCREIGHDLLLDGHTVGFIFLEETVKKTQQAMIALDNNVWLPYFRENPSIIKKEDFEASKDKLLGSNSYWLSHFGSLSTASLMTKISWLGGVGCTDIILDHLSLVISGQDSNNERKDIDVLMTEMASFCTATGVRLWVVSHIKRLNQKIYVKDEHGMEFLQVTMEDARGSAGIEQMSFNIMTVEPQKTEDGTRGCMRIRSCKNRELGWLGIADYLTLDKRTGRVIQYVPETTSEDY